MGYSSLAECIQDLERNQHLVRITREVDPYLEMAAIHLRVFKHGGPAVLFENVKGSPFPAVSNLFGTMDRCRFMFRDTLDKVKLLVNLKKDPLLAIKHPAKYLLAVKALPRSSGASAIANETVIDQLPQIQSWPNDGGAFILLPQVYTEDVDSPGVMHSNLGCYRIQMSGNEYVSNAELGLHYQIHRGIGVHQAKSDALGKPLKVSIFVGGPPAPTLASIMPLPEGLSELTFAGALNNRRFRYSRRDGYVISSEADFVLTGEVHPGETKPEGPFGDHLGYYSLQHNFPVMKVHKVYHRKDAIWPFTVVGRPPQEDTQFGSLIHEITGPVIPSEVPGLKEVNAVDAAGVHPLMLAIGSERYTPYSEDRRPQEILTIANHMLGFGQMSLAKYLFITENGDNPDLSVNNIEKYLRHVLERIDLTRDLHFHTNHTMDTLDYSGTGLNSGSKVVLASAGQKRRELAKELPANMSLPSEFTNPKTVLPGILAVNAPTYIDEKTTNFQLTGFGESASNLISEGFPLIVLCDNSDFLAESLNNFLWVTFTRSNPASDLHGVDSFTENKHWGCRGSMIIDARTKPHHAPLLELEPSVEKKVDGLGAAGQPLQGII